MKNPPNPLETGDLWYLALLTEYYRMALDAGIGGEATIDRNDRASNEAGGFVAEEPQQGTNQIFRFAEFVHRRVVQDLMGTRGETAIGRRQQTAILIRQEESRGDGIDADADRSHVDGQPLREVADSGFGGAVGGNLRQWLESVHGGDVDDAAVVLFGHILREDLRGQEGA